MTILSSEVAVREGGALAVHASQTAWSEQQLAVLHSIGIKTDVTDAELTAFLHECQQRRLDPFSKQIYLIGRYDGREKREVYRSQTGIDGFRVIAHRAADEANETMAYEDTLWCGFDGVWRDVWLDDDPPRASKVVVLRNGQRYPSVATLAEYAALKKDGDPMPMWRRMPSTMLAKCAEAQALRKAFPDDLSGIYTAEEMGQADNPVGVTVAMPQERKAERRQSGPVDDEWTKPAPVVVDAEVVQDGPVAVNADGEPMANAGQLTNIRMMFKEIGIEDRAERIKHAGLIVGRQLSSTKDLTNTEAAYVRKTLSRGYVPSTPVVEALLALIDEARDEDSFELAKTDVEREHAEGGIGDAELAGLQEHWVACRERAMAATS